MNDSIRCDFCDRLLPIRSFNQTKKVNLEVGYKCDDCRGGDAKAFWDIDNADERSAKVVLAERFKKEKENTVSGGFVYVVFTPEVESKYYGLYKIGRTTNYYNRLLKLKQEYDTNIKTFHTIRTLNPIETERWLHRKFHLQRQHGLSEGVARQEWFHLSNDDLEWLLSIRHGSQLSYKGGSIQVSLWQPFFSTTMKDNDENTNPVHLYLI